MFFFNNPIGIRFDIDKLNKHNENHCYGYTAWEIFWKSVHIGLFCNLEKFYHGDSQATLSGSENVFIIAFETGNNKLIKTIRASLTSNKDFNMVCSALQYIEGNDLMLEPLSKVGKFDLLGNFIEEKASGYDALEVLKNVYNYEIQYDKTSYLHTAIKPQAKYEISGEDSQLSEIKPSAGDGCFIATATYGDYNHPKVIEFRKFRDDFLSKKIFGRFFIKVYYLISPHLSGIVRHNTTKTNITISFR